MSCFPAKVQMLLVLDQISVIFLSSTPLNEISGSFEFSENVAPLLIDSQ